MQNHLYKNINLSHKLTSDMTPEELKDELKKTRAALEETCYVMGEILDNTSDGYWDWYLQEDYEFMSPKFWEILGYSPTEKEHKPSEWQKLIFKEDLENATIAFTEHIESRGLIPYCVKVRYQHKQGHTVHLICRGSVVKWSHSGEPIRMVGTHIDISSEIELMNRVSSSVNYANISLWEWNIRTSSFYWSDELYKLLKIENNLDQTFESFEQRVHEEDRELMVQTFYDHIEEDTPVDHKFRLRREDGIYIWVRARGRASRDSSGEALEMAGIIFAITESKVIDECEQDSKKLVQEGASQYSKSQKSFVCVFDENELNEKVG